MDGRSNTSPHPHSLAVMPAYDRVDPATFETPPCRSGGAPDTPPAILVVDDDPDVQLILQRLVQDLAPRYDIIATTDPMEALARIHGRTIPLVIADVHMPGMNGVDLAAQVKRHAPQTQVLLITAYPDPMLEQQVEHQGIEYYLPKPFAFADLKRVLDTALHRDEPPEQ